jgi:hypothetical protein
MKIKAILTIVFSLLIGFVIGFLVSIQIHEQDMKKKHSHSYHEMFMYRTLSVIEPSEGQKDTIIPIIDVYAEKSMILKNRVSNEFDSLMHQMSFELKPYVTEIQFRKLEESANGLKQRYGR